MIDKIAYLDYLYCKCGCGKKIKIKTHHKYYGIPKYIQGHNLIKEIEKLNRRKLKLVCTVCKENFYGQRINRKYCSEKCRFNLRKTKKNYINYNKKYREKNQDILKEYNKKHYSENKRLYRKWHRKSIAKSLNLSLKQYENITKKCSICFFDQHIHCHHIIPKSNGGEDRISNYLGLCPNCHKLIHTGNTVENIKEYYKSKGFDIR